MLLFTGILSNEIKHFSGLTRIASSKPRNAYSTTERAVQGCKSYSFMIMRIITPNLKTLCGKISVLALIARHDQYLLQSNHIIANLHNVYLFSTQRLSHSHKVYLFSTRRLSHLSLKLLLWLQPTESKLLTAILQLFWLLALTQSKDQHRREGMREISRRPLITSLALLEHFLHTLLHLLHLLGPVLNHRLLIIFDDCSVAHECNQADTEKVGEVCAQALHDLAVAL